MEFCTAARVRAANKDNEHAGKQASRTVIRPVENGELVEEMVIKHRQIPRTSAADSILWLVRRRKERLRAVHCNQRSSSSSAPPSFQGCGALAGRIIRSENSCTQGIRYSQHRCDQWPPRVTTGSKLSNAWSRSRGGGSQGFRASPPVEFLEDILALKGHIFSSNYT